jgi:hypothetical protein
VAGALNAPVTVVFAAVLSKLSTVWFTCTVGVGTDTGRTVGRGSGFDGPAYEKRPRFPSNRGSSQALNARTLLTLVEKKMARQKS